MGEHLENKEYKSVGYIINLVNVLNFNDIIWIHCNEKYKTQY